MAEISYDRMGCLALVIKLNCTLCKGLIYEEYICGLWVNNFNINQTVEELIKQLIRRALPVG